ncbi:mono-functional DNA-alkylating methyl methanesulfonate N-term-domain-containing protein [Peziza echinospora]|nr:mono-functional DNA-alkylating methyl methanesulfonate N-term-domain-containing protein [Peziza echinospora]
MAYIASIHKASSVRHAVQSNFLNPNEQSLIVAKSNRVEIYSVNTDLSDEPTSLTLGTTFTVYGLITVLLTLRPETSTTDHLFIATDKYDYFTISWDHERQTIRNERTARDISLRSLRNAKYGAIYLTDPKARMLGLHIYQGIFTVIPLVQQQSKYGKRGKSKQFSAGEAAVGDMCEPVPIRLQELKVVDMAFLDTPGEPTVAMLYEDAMDNVNLKVYKIKASGKGKATGAELEEVTVEAQFDRKLDPGSKIIIPVPEAIGGMIILGEQTVAYFPTHGTPKKRPLPDATVFVTWGMIDDQNYLMGDDYGRLYLLELKLNAQVEEIVVKFLGKVSTPSRLVCLGNSHVYVGSHLGDSQLVKLSFSPPGVEIVQTFSNLAPVVDFRILDMGFAFQEEHHLYSSGQTRIVSGSGAFHDGSLRSLRSGVGLEELGILGEMSGIRGLWSLKTEPDSEYHDTLLISFIDETRVFKFSPEGDVDELEEFKGFSLSEAVLTAANVRGGRLLQVTALSVTLSDALGGNVISVWRPHDGTRISLASANENTLVLATSHSEVVLFDLVDGLKEVKRRTFEHEVATLYMPTIPSNVCVMGSWTTSDVSVLSVPTLETLLEANLGEGGAGVIPRSLFLGQIMENQPPTLMVAMGDGRLFTFSYNTEDNTVSEKKIIVLGIQPVYLQPIPAPNGLVNVFATCDYPSLVYGAQGRIVCSAVTLKSPEKTTFVTPFHAEAFPDSVVAASESTLKITVVDPMRTTHIQTLPIGDVVRRVCYSKEHRAFVIVTINLSVDEVVGAEQYRSFVKVVDDTRFEVIDSFELQDDEFVEAIMCTKLENGDGTSSEKFVVGSGFHETDEDTDEPKRGKIRVFELGEERKLKVACVLELKGSCKCLDMVGDRIVAALQKTIAIYTYSHPTSPSSPKLINISSYRVQSEPIDLSVSENIIAVGDMMKGVSLLECSPTTGLLSEVARNHTTQWTTAVCLLDPDTVLSSDAEGNILMQKWDHQSSPSAVGIKDEKRKLQNVGEMRIAEMVNRFRKIDESYNTPITSIAKTHPDAAGVAAVTPRAYFATVEGSISILCTIDNPDHQNLLMKLQANLARYVKGVGDLEFMRFRAFESRERTGDEPFRIVDGDFLERFLELPEEVMVKVVSGGEPGEHAGEDPEEEEGGEKKKGEGLGEEWGVEEVKAILEGLRGLH